LGPKRLDIEITRKCKFNCAVCSVRASNHITEPEVTLDSLQNKILEFSELGGTEISITGGEPSERGIPFLVELVKFSKNLNMNVRMYCVGYGFQKTDDVELLKQAGLDYVIITLAGPQKIDEQFKGVKGSYEIALKAIELFRKNHIEVIIHFTPTKLTYRHLPHVIDTAYELGVEKIRIMSFVPQGRGWDNRHLFDMNESEKQEFSQIIQNVKQTLDLQFSGSFDMDETGDDSCLVAKNRFVITSDGFLIPSFALRMDKEKSTPNPAICLGNVNDTSLKSAWTSKLLLDARTQSHCSSCPSCAES